MRDASPWFVAADVCETLGYKNPSKAIADHLDNDEKSNQSLGLAGKPLIIINESGLYALVLRSRKPEARKFAKWVTSEVLPAIRKTGKYEDGAQPKHPNINDEIAKLADPNIYPDTVIREIGKVVSARMDNRLSTVDDRRGLVD
ncbi:MAG: hypothetical protein KGM99_16115, partial [Burkholderiales bacterium]|nr:hypothetical protein [Burkholderiales bacterium]